MAANVSWNLKPLLLLLVTLVAVVMYVSLHGGSLDLDHLARQVGVANSYDFSEVDFLEAELPAGVLGTVKDNQLPAKANEGKANVMGVDVFYRHLDGSETSTNESGASLSSAKTFLLLHGQAFTSKNWFVIKTAQTLAALGHRVIAVDLPGYGNSGLSATASKDKGAFLEALIDKLSPDAKPIIVSPSMSGTFSLPLLIKNSNKMCAYVPVAPVGTGDFSPEQYARVHKPTLIVVGERDTSLGRTSVNALSQIPSASKAQVIPGARHPAYLDDSDRWHKLLYNFANRIEC